MALTPAAALVAEIGVDGEVAAAGKLAAFGAQVEATAAKQVAGASRIGGAFRALDGQLASFGLPFGGALGAVSKGLEATEQKGASFGTFLTNLGAKEALIGALGLATVGTEAIHLADTQEIAQARMDQAIVNTGHVQAQYRGQIDATNKSMEALGFTHAETEASTAKLIPVTGSTQKALELQATAADLARGRGVDLATATTALVRVEGGRYTLLGRLLGLSQQQVASIHNEADAVNLITRLYGGQAQAAADTFAGKLKTLRAEGEDLGAGFGTALIPQVERFVGITTATVGGIQTVNSAMDGWGGKIALGVAAIPILTFATAKLDAAVVATSGAYSASTATIAGWLGITAAATPESAALAAAQEAVAVAEANVAAAAAAAAGPLSVLVGEAGALTPEMIALAAAEEEAAVAGAQLATAEAAAATGAGALSTVLGPLALGAAAVYGSLKLLEVIEPNFGSSIDAQAKTADKALQETGHQSAEMAQQTLTNFGISAKALDVYRDALLKGVPAAEAFAAALRQNTKDEPLVGNNPGELQLWTSDIDKFVGSLDPLSRAQQQLSAATEKLAEDTAGGHASRAQLAADHRAVAQASGDETAAQDALNSATDTGAESVNNLDASLKQLNDDLSAKKANFDIGSSVLSEATAVDQVATAQQALTEARQNAAGVGEQAVSAARSETNARQSLSNAIVGEETATQSLVDAKQKLAQFDAPTDVRIRSLERTQIVDRVVTTPEQARQKEIDLLKFDEDSANKRTDLQKQVGTAEAGVVSATRQVASAQQSVSDAVKARQKVQSDATAAIITDERKVEAAVIAVANAQLDVEAKILGGVNAAATAAKDYVDATSGLTGAALKVAEQNAEQTAAQGWIDSQTAAYPKLKTEIDHYATALGLVPASVHTTVSLDISQALDAITLEQAALRGTGTITETVGGVQVGSAVHTKSHATGGRIDVGEWGTKGENELLHALPGGGVEIFTAQQSARMGGGGGSENAALLAKLDQIHAALRDRKPPINAPQHNYFSSESPSQADLEFANRAHSWQLALEISAR